MTIVAPRLFALQPVFDRRCGGPWFAAAHRDDRGGTEFVANLLHDLGGARVRLIRIAFVGEHGDCDRPE